MQCHMYTFPFGNTPTSTSLAELEEHQAAPVPYPTILRPGCVFHRLRSIQSPGSLEGRARVEADALQVAAPSGKGKPVIHWSTLPCAREVHWKTAKGTEKNGRKNGR